MNDLMTTILNHSDILGYLVIDMAVSIVLIGGVRYTMGIMSNINTNDELAKKDNFAYGISVAGAICAMGIALSGVITGEAAGSYKIELIGMFSYGISAMILIKAGRYIHDELALPQFKKLDQIINRNMAVGVVDAACVVSTAIVVRAAIMWVHGLTLDTFIALFSAWIVSQFMLVLITKIFAWKYNINNGVNFQTVLEQGQLALAIRYSGYLISTAMSVTAASYFIIFNSFKLWHCIILWTTMSLLLMLCLTLLTSLAKFIVLWGINRKVEVEDQHNIGVALIEFAISFSIALLLMALMN
ncbi:MAG: DUF350 domain-containing protein [Psychromonas sp.]|nr:DUF350 domain-containing protein [Psychromonas sp.]